MKIISATILLILFTLSFSKVSASYTCNSIDFGSFCDANSTPYAFPGAEGWGAESVEELATTTGGRGGKVFFVTNTNNGGSGSLRECIDAEGARTCIFKTGGTIELNSGLVIENDNITIAGQTASGDGILLKNNFNNYKETPLIINASNVVVRYVTVRADPGKPGDDSGHSLDGISIGSRDTAVRDVILDHVSVSWSTDEVFNSWRDSREISIQWSNFSEGLAKSTHEKDGNHSRGPLFGNADGGRVSFHHNIAYRNLSRNPRMSTGKGLVNDIVNNYVAAYGFGIQFAESYGAEPHGNVVGNVLENGGKDAIEMRHEPDNPDEGAGALIYISDNLGPSRKDGDPEWLDAWVETTYGNGSKEEEQLKDNHPFRSMKRLEAPLVTTIDSSKVKETILACAGNNMGVIEDGSFNTRRDEAEQRILSDINNGEKGYIDFPSEVGGFPKLSSGIPYKDSDNDGMGDAWEISYFDSTSVSNLENGKAVKDTDNDGYTDLEEFLNGTNPVQAEQGCSGSSVKPTPTSTPSPQYDSKFDLDGNGAVDILDIIELVRYIFR